MLPYNSPYPTDSEIQNIKTATKWIVCLFALHFLFVLMVSVSVGGIVTCVIMILFLSIGITGITKFKLFWIWIVYFSFFFLHLNLFLKKYVFYTCIITIICIWIEIDLIFDSHRDIWFHIVAIEIIIFQLRAMVFKMFFILFFF